MLELQWPTIGPKLNHVTHNSGYGFVKAEDDTISNANDGLILRASGEYQYQWYTGSRLRQFLSAEIGANNIKTRSETALSANLFDSLAMKLSFVVAYETQPVGDISGLNTETSLSVVYRFFWIRDACEQKLNE